MISYFYRCPDCGHEVTIEQRITDDKVQTCPKCGSAKFHRPPRRAPLVQFKGGGWFDQGYMKGEQ